MYVTFVLGNKHDQALIPVYCIDNHVDQTKRNQFGFKFIFILFLGAVSATSKQGNK